MSHVISHPAPEYYTFQTKSAALASEVAQAAQRRGCEANWNRNERAGKPNEFVVEVWECGRDSFSAILGEATRAVSQLKSQMARAA